MLKPLAALGAFALLSGLAGAAAAATIPDASFEDPAGAGGFVYRPVVAGVVFTGDAGVVSGTGFDSAPDGVQNAFLQSTADAGANIDISVSGLTAGSVYSFSFFDDQRNGYGANPYTVAWDGVTIGAFTPAASGWTARTTDTFTALASSGTLTFNAPLRCCDNDAGIDAITLNSAVISAVPEPATWAFMLFGVGGLGAALRKRRRDTFQTA